MPCVVAVNRFPNDTDEEVELVRTLSLEAGALDAQHNTAVVDGGEGAADLARAVVKAANAPSDFKLTYPDEASIEDKIAAIATKVYGADGVEFLPERAAKLKRFDELGTATCRSAWPRRTSRSRTIRACRARRPASRCRSATCASTRARAS